ncbi:thioredoxin domain-containing protein [Galbitalea soli]|uniref:Thioredoxin domain-containing protein n=1 Tax=Galbitalea soli TaxID=1268042 RepID=A0A7C9TR53_9MICO|nr:DUF255 domain-containing protein [Galbitalea soli]NEM90783.1 thioredoxin domain-containing protein [Galbitalea soli]NYJ31501.1 hypothetical protein [Galbitalea soli]
MANRLAEAVSPYLRSHADNPVDWFPWGAEAFAEAARRDVPVLISIGYSTCHWCHVMARESFSDPELAAVLNARFVSIKVDREEHPDVDSSYLSAAAAFTDQLGWPLTVFATPSGRAFFAGSYFPPVAMGDHPAFRDVLDAVWEAWTSRRDEVERSAAQLAAAIVRPSVESRGPLPGDAEFAAIVAELASYEDDRHSGFGGAPKFPVAPTLLFLLDREAAGDDTAGGLARRTLHAIAGTGWPDAPFTALRDRVGGGFFRYATRRDWSEPHYERMLYDNAQLLEAYTRAAVREPEPFAEIAAGLADYLVEVMQQPGGGFASAQDSESVVDGARVEGDYYALDAVARADQAAPALDEKVVTGWNGLAIGALALAATVQGREDWLRAALRAAERVAEGELVRARIAHAVSIARPALEDFGMLATGLLDLAAATGDPRWAERARDLVDATRHAAPDAPARMPFAVPGGADPVLAAQGLALDVDPSEGAYPSGVSALAAAALRLYHLTGESGYRAAAADALGLVAPLAAARPMSFGAALRAMSSLARAPRQLVVVTGDRAEGGAGDDPLALLARRSAADSSLTVVVVTAEQRVGWADAGFGLLADRTSRGGATTAFLCEDFVCRLPVTGADELRALL